MRRGNQKRCLNAADPRPRPCESSSVNLSAPDRKGLAPVRIHGHDAALAESVAGLIQPGADGFTKIQEIGFGDIRQSVLGDVPKDDGIVLIGFESLFPAAFASHNHKDERFRWRPALFEGLFRSGVAGWRRKPSQSGA